MFTLVIKWNNTGNAFITASAQSKCSKVSVGCYYNLQVTLNSIYPSLLTTLLGRYLYSPHFTDEETKVQWW